MKLALFRGISPQILLTHFTNPLIYLSRTMAEVGGVSDMRAPYRTHGDSFDVDDLVSREPFLQFKNWFEEAKLEPNIEEANAMALATATKNGSPSVRMVLMKGFDKNGIVFYTNYNSRKAAELEENPRCSCMFYWEQLKRSIRVEGSVSRLSKEKSEEYFNSRPRPSQLGALSSNQGSIVDSRKTISDRFKSLSETYKDEDKTIPKPDCWGGYLVTPDLFEFWQGQTTRLHDRICFRRLATGEKVDEKLTHIGEDGWVFERLEP
ncbi:pyridoxamine 5'-phosphate oxidase [Mytilus galloprovincialis]|uniref:pyridoxal 5'-phosphate synthase n=1 Tax=Mytilus galloprovincialis TaxID=29158 RepID=A0A8B6EXR5_MYTGA|nr:pyridoxamine 5'-phosphate oxidase [Mytilus galloprovincialis]